MVTDRRQHPSVLQMVQQNDEKHDTQHVRLRGALDKVTTQVDGLEAVCLKLEHRLSVVEKARPEFDNMIWTTQRVVMIVATVLSVAGGMYASTYGLRSDVRDILTRGDAQIKLQEERANTLGKSIDEMKRRVELQQFQIGELKDMMVKQQGAKR